jgi:hypothetical protein
MFDGPFGGCIAASCLPGDLISCDTFDGKPGSWAIIISNEIVELSSHTRIVRVIALFQNGLASVLPTKRVTIHKGVVR